MHVDILLFNENDIHLVDFIHWNIALADVGQSEMNDLHDAMKKTRLPWPIPIDSIRFFYINP